MNYTVQELANLAGVTTRTLRYYDQIGLLKPSFLTVANYRMYTQVEVDQLHQILLLKELALPLRQIQEILNKPEQETLDLLVQHQEALKQKQRRLVNILRNVNETIAVYQGEKTMTNEEKFAAFKNELVAENEKKHGAEIRQKYSTATIEAANQKMLNLTEEEYQQYQDLETDIINRLKNHATLAVPSSEAERLFAKHQAWLQLTLPHYQVEIHRNLGLMYVGDSRFTAYYDKRAGEGAATCLNEIIQHYTS